MQSIIQSFRDSARELKNVRVLAATALLIALNLILSKFQFYITPNDRVSLSFLATATVGALFGPVVGMSAGMVCDVLAFLLNPQPAPYFPGFTITAMMGGMIYGLVLYRRDVTTPRAFLAKGLVSLVCNVGLNSIWKYMLYGKALYVLLPAAVIKNLLLFPFESLILVTVCSSLLRIYRRSHSH